MRQARLELAAEFTADLRRIDVQLRETRKKLAVAVRASGSTVTEVFGVGPVVAATVIGDVRDVSRFASRDRFAAYDGTAPIEVSSGNRKVHRLSLRGNRRLNHAIHMAAINWIRYQHSDGRAYYDKKIAEGKTPKEALRALKRQISDAIYKHLTADAARAAAAGAQGPGGQPGNDSVASAAGSHPERQLFGQATPGPVTTLRRPADQQKGPAHAPGKRPPEPLDTKRHRYARQFRSFGWHRKTHRTVIMSRRQASVRPGFLFMDSSAADSGQKKPAESLQSVRPGSASPRVFRRHDTSEAESPVAPSALILRHFTDHSLQFPGRLCDTLVKIITKVLKWAHRHECSIHAGNVRERLGCREPVLGIRAAAQVQEDLQCAPPS